MIVLKYIGCTFIAAVMVAFGCAAYLSNRESAAEDALEASLYEEASPDGWLRSQAEIEKENQDHELWLESQLERYDNPCPPAGR